MKPEKTYWQKLKQHPGVPILLLMTLAFYTAAISKHGWEPGLIIGSIVSVPMWAIVLWTARSQP